MNKYEAQKQQWEFALALLKEKGIEPLDEKMTLNDSGNIVVHSKNLVNCLSIGPKMTNEEIINYVNREVETTTRHLEKSKQFKKIYPNVKEGSSEWVELYNKFNIYFEEKHIAKEFLKLYANEQVVLDTLADIQDNDYIHSDRWSLVYDMLNENFPAEWRKAATGLVYLVEDKELEEVLNTLNYNPSNKSVADIIADATDRVVTAPDGVSNKEIDM